MPNEIDSKPSARLRSLDGLRGVAALVVVLHHSLITYPLLRGVFEDGPAIQDRNSVAWWMVQTPLHLFWSGGEAVFVFFILSGIALAMMRSKTQPTSWARYYPSRLLRLYIPVWASILFSLAVFFTVGLISESAKSSWFHERQTSLHLGSLVKAALILRGTYRYNGPLWSLLWEVIFSVLLPVFIVLLLRAPTNTKFVLVIATLTAGAVLRSEIPPVGNFLLYMAMFGLGVLFAGRRGDLEHLAERISSASRSGLLWGTLLTLGCVTLCTYWYLQPLELPIQVLHLTYVVQVAGAFVIVFCAAYYPGMRSALTTRPILWLGKISFSLYLVHDPILLALNHLTGESAQPLVIAVGIPLSLAVASLFARVVERPSHRLSKRIEKGPFASKTLEPANAVT